MRREGTLLLKRSEVAALLRLEECIEAVEHVFRLHGEGKVAPPGILGVHARDGGFHIKAGLLEMGGRTYFAGKTNANFPHNMERHALPLIQGVIVLCDASNGYPVALMDSIEISIIRTGAATGVAARHLARANSTVVSIFGCGNQGRISLRALAKVRPIKRVFAFDRDEDESRRFAHELSGELGIEVTAVADPAQSVLQSDICVTCTPSKQYFLNRDMVAPGTFIAAVGADNEDKQELDPQLLVSNKIVVDLLEQSATIGDLHHALDKGLVTRADVHAELGEVVAGRKTGRTSEEEIIIFDSTGVAFQDVVAAAVVYERAMREGRGTIFDFVE